MDIDLEAIWRAAEAALPPGYELTGFHYQGPEFTANSWVALASTDARDRPGEIGSCEGAGPTPDKAAEDLLRHIQQHHSAE
jgi:hypothetical protein